MNEKHLLIFTVGKVGSTSVYDSCKDIPLFHAYHLHHLTPRAIDAQRQTFENKSEPMYQHIKDAIKIMDEELIGNKDVKIINIVRDPVARSLSHFFQSYYMPLSDNANALLKMSETKPKDFIFNKVREDFLRVNNHTEPFEWTNSELSYVVQSNPFSGTFNSKKGCGLIMNNKTEILTIQCEISDARKLKYINSFLDSNIKALYRSNITKNENVGTIYQMMKSKLKFPSEFLNSIYQSEYCKHYYTDKQLSNFYLQWIA